VRSFAYLDLVLQDTPLNDRSVEWYLRDSVHHVDNLADREEEKLQRMSIRFERVARFLDYLQKEEVQEIKTYGLQDRDSVIADQIVPVIKSAHEQERLRIERRLRENRERYAEDVVAAVSTDAEDLLPGIDAEGDDEEALAEGSS
jgi:rhamnose utilization protein RhaD (predicted bifunctional aldolase and dehydrogenase)